MTTTPLEAFLTGVVQANLTSPGDLARLHLFPEPAVDDQGMINGIILIRDSRDPKGDVRVTITITEHDR